MAAANQRISEYVLEAKVGGGGFGEVWRAHHHVWIDQLVAIKIPTDPQYLRNLQREGVAIHGLVHPNIVRAIGFDPYAETPYLIMEYVPGSSLRPYIAQKSLSVADTIEIMKQILAGLAYAHANNLVHRDVKPENILIHERAAKEGFSSPGVVKITDFGLGKAAVASLGGPGASIAYSQSLNSPGAADIAGTLDYMSPEQRSGGTVDGRADLYACGVILYEMLTGERPAGTDCPSDVNHSAPKYLDDVFRRSYARLDKRFSTAEEFAKALTPAQPPPLPPVGVSGGPAGVQAGGVWPAASSPGQTTCPQCQKAVDRGDQFCMHCGVQLADVVRRCPQCGAYPDANDRFCIFCGQTLGG
ncbi:MAG TPA: serine/threonine-protein kinase [Tepidisphaeraceae bacterium]|nr:serine/threonine-protein kinase [Tepidisphaeraceae bacterium]